MKSVMFIGYGSMARKVHEMLPKNIVLSTVVASPSSAEKIKTEIGESIDVITCVDDLKNMPDLAIEMSAKMDLKNMPSKSWRRAYLLALSLLVRLPMRRLQ